MLAQGANMAIEDGMVLARCLAAYDDVETALARYDAARVERTAKLVRGANDMAKRFHNPALAEATGAKAYVDAQWNEDDREAALRLDLPIRRDRAWRSE